MPSKNVNSFLTVNSLNLSAASILTIVGGELKRFTGQTIVIDSSGNVGIGISSPTSLLHVYNSANSGKLINIANPNAGTGAYAGVDALSDTVSLSVRSYGSTFNTFTHAGIALAGAAEIWADTLSGSGPQALLIGIKTAKPLIFATNNTERLRIDSSGNVGVGTASPSQKLDIQSASASVQIKSTTATNSAILKIENNSTAYIGNETSSANSLFLGTTAYATCLGNTGAYPVQLATNNNVRMTIDSSGNVGIGTVSPSSPLVVSRNANDNLTRIILDNPNAGSSAQTILGLSNDGGTAAGLKLGSSTYSGTGGANVLDVFNNVSHTIFSIGGTERLRIDSSGGVTIAGLAGAGSRAVNASAAGLLSAASDASLKEEVVGAHIAGLDEILQIHPKMYRWKEDIANRGDEASVELGFIANDVAPIIPSAAPMGNDGLYGFYDRSITAALVKAVQELKVEIDILKNK
jgi:trimeric autotransporter adhesin